MKRLVILLVSALFAALTISTVLACPTAAFAQYSTRRQGSGATTQEAPPPPPVQPPNRAGPYRISWAPPRDLTSTTDATVCGQHGGFAGSLLCREGLPLGRLALIWSFDAGAQAFSGFHVYRVDGGRRDLVDNVTSGADMTISLVQPSAGACYAVAVYLDRDEGALSRPYCAGGGATVQTAALSPTSLRSVSRIASSGDMDLPSVVRVGFQYSTDKSSLGDYSLNEVWRAGVLFDVTALANRNIRSAHLRLSVRRTLLGEADLSGAHIATPSDDHTSCVARLGLGQGRWWTDSDWIDATVALSPGLEEGPDVSFDVTSIVRRWTNGDPNFGIVLLGEEENLGAFTEKGCVSDYLPDRVRLEVEYD